MSVMEKQYERTYTAGRPTDGWDRGERITERRQVKPGDILIVVCHQFKAENLSLVVDLPEGFSGINHGRGFYSVWAHNQTAKKGGPEEMFTWDWEFTGEAPRLELYRAIDKRPDDLPDTRIRADKLPAWLSYRKS